MSLCFEATATTGTLRLALPDEEGDAVAAALALAEHEPLIAALEDWLQQALDPHPVPHAEAGPPLLWAQAGAVHIGLPWSLLAAQPQAPAWPLRWPALCFDVDVAGFDAAPLPADAQGGVLLLPPALEPAWRVSLHDAAQGLVAEAEWRGPGTELLLCAPPERAAVPRSAWRVSLADACRRPLPELLGWEPATMPWRPGARAVLSGPQGHAQAGRIAPALQAYGLWLTA